MPTPARSLALATIALASFVTVARAESPPARIQVAPWCDRSAGHVGFHLVFAEGDRRTVVNLTCDRTSRACSGAKLELGRIDRGDPLGWLALGGITGAQIEQTGDELTHVRWGGHAITMNHRGGFVSLDGVQARCQ